MSAKRGFGSDNHAGIHPRILAAIAEANTGHAPSYGTDEWSQKAEGRFRELFGADSEVFFVFNGTAANVTALQALTQSYQSVFCSDVSHLAVDECGAPEFFTGAKLIPIPSQDGKLAVADLEAAWIRRGDQHYSQSQVLSLTQPTELGTAYSLEELRALTAWAKKKNLFVHMDGARFANAVSFLKTDFKSLTKDSGVDALSFGGTKNGLMMGEAVVFLNPVLARDFKFRRKQAGQLPSKTRFIAAQFLAYLQDDLWREIADHSCRMAEELYQALQALPRLELRSRPQSNAVFAKIPKEWIKPLRESFFFYVWDEKTFECRLMTSWDTQSSDIQNFAQKIKELAK